MIHKLNLNILIIDDDDGDRKRIKRSLKGLSDNLVIKEASNIDTAIELAEDQDFDCALIDYRMPGTSSIEGIKALKATAPYLAVIMVTGQGDEDIAAEAFKSGALDYISKNTDLENTLKDKITYALEKANLEKKIEEQKQALEQYAHILAHDLLGPLRNINSLIPLIKNAIQKQEYDQLGEFFGFVEISATNMSAIIDSLKKLQQCIGRNTKF